jgi:hypothetical protein
MCRSLPMHPEQVKPEPLNVVGTRSTALVSS